MKYLLIEFSYFQIRSKFLQYLFQKSQMRPISAFLLILVFTFFEISIVFAEDVSDILTVNKPLREGQYLKSKNGVFVAVMQSDANFVVYRGTSSSDITHGKIWDDRKNVGGCPCFVTIQSDGNLVIYHGTGMNDQKDVIWATNKYNRGDNSTYFLNMQDDGNLVVYHGSSPANRGDVQWASGLRDEVTGFESLQDINYRLADAKVVSTNSVEIYNQDVHNDTDQPQTSTISGSRSVDEQSGWSDSITNKVGIKNEASVKTPIFEDKIEISYEHEWSYADNGSTTTSKEWGFSTPITLQPHTSGKVVVSVSQAQISVPYSISGSVVFKSGIRMPINTIGVYTGTNSFDMKVVLTNSLPTGTVPLSGGRVLQEKRLTINSGITSIIQKK